MFAISSFTYDPHNRWHRLLRKLLITVISLVIFVEVWWVLAIVAHSNAVPTPLETWDALVNLIRHGDTITGLSLGTYIGSSFQTFMKGFILALIVAVPLGLVLGTFKTVRELAEPVIEILRPIAPIAWAPILMLAINYQTGPMLVVFIGIFFPLLTNIIFGVQKIDKNLVEA